MLLAESRQAFVSGGHRRRLTGGGKAEVVLTREGIRPGKIRQLAGGRLWREG